MRNVVPADRLASALGVSGAVIAAFADADCFPTARKVRSGKVGGAAFFNRTLLIPLSYQSIVGLAKSVSEHPDEWNELAAWVERKIGTVATRMQNAATSGTDAHYRMGSRAV